MKKTEDTNRAAIKKATKRIPLTPTTFDSLYYLKEPRESWDDMVIRLITHEQERALLKDMQNAGEPGEFIPLSEIEKEIEVTKNGSQNVTESGRVLHGSSRTKTGASFRSTCKDLNPTLVSGV
ncbi:MAG: hypothetical protein NTV68_10350, partial [Methanomicrobiales archaeon]|nr:hypothetical protein [Methanomicrobiales archaeon]